MFFALLFLYLLLVSLTKLKIRYVRFLDRREKEAKNLCVSNSPPKRF